jgi:membrane-bound lytic murein transglycosylase MltF
VVVDFPPSQGGNMKKKKKKKSSGATAHRAKANPKKSSRRVSLRNKARSPKAVATGLSFDKVLALVKTNKKSTAFTDECVVAVCWKESSFDPSAHAGSSTAKGLMQMTNPAVDTVNNITPVGVHFEYADMLDASKAIQCGTYYLQWCYDHSGSDEGKALDKFAGVSGYATNVMAAEKCLLSGGDPTTCLKQIHPFQIERQKTNLVDDPSGASRFTESKE